MKENNYSQARAHYLEMSATDKKEVMMNSISLLLQCDPPIRERMVLFLLQNNINKNISFILQNSLFLLNMIRMIKKFVS